MWLSFSDAENFMVILLMFGKCKLTRSSL
jgi:hypothetical protein